MNIMRVGSSLTAILVTFGLTGCANPASTETVPDEEAERAFHSFHPFAVTDDAPSDRSAALQQAMAHRDQMRPMQRPRQAGPILDALFPFWHNVGPINFHSGQDPNGFNDTNAGRVNAVAFDPQRNGTWYLASPNGGIWKTTDFGSHWAPISDSWSCLQTSTVVVDPRNSDIVYAGGGDHMGGSICSNGVMKSTDAGATWSSAGLSGITIPRLVVDPDNSSNVIAVTSWGYVYRSTDAGASWNVVVNAGTDWSDVAFSPPDFLFPRYFYAVGNGQGGGLFYRSQDQGATWTQKTLPLTVADVTGVPVTQVGLSVATSLINPSVVYVLAPSDKKMLVSYNAGDSWTDITGNLANDGWFWTQVGYNYALAVSTLGDGRLGGSGQDVVYVGTTDAYRSIGGNNVWTPIDTGGADQHGLAVNPFDRNSLLAASDAGVSVLTYNPTLGITTRFATNSTLDVMELYEGAYSRSRADDILCGAQDNGNPFSNGSLGNWINEGGGDGGSAAINPLNDNWAYLTINFSNNQRQLWRTDNGWASKQQIAPTTNNEPAAMKVPTVIDPSRPWFLYVATNYLYRFDENAYLALHDKSQYQSAWSSHVGGQKLSSTSAVNAVAVAETDFNRIYTASGDGEIWMTRDGGASWQRIDGGGFNGQGFTSLAVNRQNADDVLVGIWRNNGVSHVWRTTNPGSATWTDVTRQNQPDGLPQVSVNTIARDPAAPATSWYVGTDIGVFYTDDAGAHWYNATKPLGMPNLPVADLKATPEGYLNAATYGRGIWRAALGCQPKSCASIGANCGTIDDGCGGTRNCGDSCPAGLSCGGGGTPNVCGSCTPYTCATLGAQCGQANDGCGGKIECGGCDAGLVCSANACVPKRCVPKRCQKGWYWNPDDCLCERGLPM